LIELDRNWLKRRWYDFRNGHSLYLIFALTGANFILIFHRLLIERIPILNDFLGNLWVFAIIFVICYVPVAVGMGVWHRKYILKIDQEQGMRQNLLLAKMFRSLLDIQTGKASKDEIEKMREFFVSIEEGRG
jgi:hypothetical protein